MRARCAVIFHALNKCGAPSLPRLWLRGEPSALRGTECSEGTESRGPPPKSEQLTRKADVVCSFFSDELHPTVTSVLVPVGASAGSLNDRCCLGPLSPSEEATLLYCLLVSPLQTPGLPAAK